MNYLPFPALSALRISEQDQGARGYLPCKQNRGIFPGRKMIGFSPCGHHKAVLADFKAYPLRDMRVLAAIGLPLRTHNAVSGDLFSYMGNDR